MAASKAAKTGSRGGSSSGGGAKTAAKSASKGASKGGASGAKSSGGAKSASSAKSGGAAKGGASKGGAAKSRTNHGNPWSAADMKQLRQLARERTLIRVAAEQLGRSLDSVKSKASEEGISFKGPKRAAAAGKRSR